MKVKKRLRLDALVLCGAVFLGIAGGGQAQTVMRFTNGGGDRLFSNPENWEGWHEVDSTSRVEVIEGTTKNAPLVVDTGDTQATGSLIGNLFISGPRAGAFVQVGRDCGLLALNRYIGGGRPGWSGQVEVLDGGTFMSPYSNSGSVCVGASKWQSGIGPGRLILHAGAVAGPLGSLYVSEEGTIEFLASSSALCRLDLKGDEVWEMNGCIKVDLTALKGGGEFDLISHESDGTAGATMQGALRQWLDAGQGKQSGKGDGKFGDGLFEVVGAGNRSWTLEYSETSGGGTVSLKVQ